MTRSGGAEGALAGAVGADEGADGCSAAGTATFIRGACSVAVQPAVGVAAAIMDGEEPAAGAF